MREYTTEKIRNVALVGHQGAGKTSLVEALLFSTGATTRLGRIEEGNTVSDWDDEEHARKVSLSTSLLPIEYQDHKVNILDAPGYTDFQGEIKNAILAADTVVVVIDSVAGVQVGTELVWEYTRAYRQPIIVVINKMERENADLDRVLENLRETFTENKFVPITLPIGKEAGFKGVVNLLTRKAYLGAGDQVTDAPGDMADDMETARIALIEAAAESDDALMEKYFAEETLSDEEILMGLRKATRDPNLNTVLVLVASATHNIGSLALLETLITYARPPAERPMAICRGESAETTPLDLPLRDAGPLAAYVFKTTTDKYVGTLNYFRVFSGKINANETCFNASSEAAERFNSLLTARGKQTEPATVFHAGDLGVVAKLSKTKTGDTFSSKEKPLIVPKPAFPDPLYTVAVTPRTQADSTKMGPTLSSLCEADPTLRWRQDLDIHQTVLEGMGEAHVSSAVSRAERLGVNIDTAIPRVPYRETVTREAEITYRHKKQTGGSGQFAEVSMRAVPNPGGGYAYESQVFGGAISSNYLPSIDKGIQAVLKVGVIAGFPIQDVKVVIFDGKEHPVDSKPIAFEIAGREGFKGVFRDAGPVLMEPIMDVTITVPDTMMGDIMGDLSSRRGRVQGTDSVGKKSVIHTQVPLAEMLRYGNELRSLTGGRGIYEMKFDHYEQVPAHLMEEVIRANQKKSEEE